ncbi:hypothetical protein [Pseudomonas syringae]|uniref:hypothetical protein n=1 Tax=Pseudomonas syringae TaxID=317 RepID=UPI001F424345|nr:hypothetical protein [Pseudomonas syringae]MCF5721036.1 hypothetical protein [Pseudomonas syringae]
MKRFYSPSTGNTYLQGLHTDIPGDAVAIDEDRYQAVIANPEPGKIRSHDANGLPVLIDPVAVTREQQLLSAFERQMRGVSSGLDRAIAAGFMSQALGAAHFYTSQPDDQVNLTGASVLGEPMAITCSDERGIKAGRMHSLQQIRQVVEDLASHKLHLQQHAGDLKQKLTNALAAQDLQAVQAVAWELPA